MRITHSQSYELEHFCLDPLCRIIFRWKDAKISLLIGLKPAQRRKMRRIANFGEFLVH